MIYFTTNIGGDHSPPAFFDSLLMVDTHQLLLQILSLIKKYTQDTLKWQLFQIFFMEFLLCLTSSVYNTYLTSP